MVTTSVGHRLETHWMNNEPYTGLKWTRVTNLQAWDGSYRLVIKISRISALEIGQT